MDGLREAIIYATKITGMLFLFLAVVGGSTALVTVLLTSSHYIAALLTSIAIVFVVITGWSVSKF